MCDFDHCTKRDMSLEPQVQEGLSDDLDPRIKEELDQLNAATDEINKLEKELDEARALFRQTLSDSSTKLNQLLKKHKRSITKAREYYQTSSLAKKTQAEAQQAAVQFRRASSFYNAAKETIHLAEQRLAEDEVSFDEAWQEMLNHSTMKMMEAEKEKMRNELEHHRKSLVYQGLENKVHKLERSHRRSITHARPYYELKLQLEIQLQQQKQNVDDLQSAVSGAKSQYKSAMCKLESISEEIHERRQIRDLPIRTPGVGCDSDEEFPLEINLEKHLDFDMSDDCYSTSTDASSLWSCDSESVGAGYCPAADGISLNSSDFPDSAICSPHSLSLERKLSDCLQLSTLAPSSDAEASQRIEDSSRSTLVPVVGDVEEEEEEEEEDEEGESESVEGRGRTGTILAN